MKKIEYENFEIELTDDYNYSTKSVDNVNVYKYEYYNGEIVNERIYPSCKHGIRIKDITTKEEISSAIICEIGESTTIHDKSFFISEDKMWLCACDKIYCLNLPELTIEWCKRIDYSTNFSINKYKDDFLIHGELGVIRIKLNGEIMWRFGGYDIFVTENESESFIIKDDIIEITDWSGYTYKINDQGVEIKESLRKRNSSKSVSRIIAKFKRFFKGEK